MNSDFLNTPSYSLIKGFILSITSSIKEDDQTVNMEFDKILEDINNVIEVTPLSTERGRYANPNAILVFNTLSSDINDVYLINSFGNSKRLDYGTGHELNFLCFCYTAVAKGDLKINQVYLLFKKYWEVSRHFIRKFNLEPAGSMGSWSLDDYQLLPFVFGKADKEESAYRRLIAKSKCVVPVGDVMEMYDREVLSRGVVTKSFIFGEYLRK